jgi:hypothetical protein
MEIAGNAYRYNEESTLQGVSFRAVNEAYPESTGTLNQKIETLAVTSTADPPQSPRARLPSRGDGCGGSRVD